MWTSENRGRYDRGKLRYPSENQSVDETDAASDAEVENLRSGPTSENLR
jgi:hypothetical protein